MCTPSPRPRRVSGAGAAAAAAAATVTAATVAAAAALTAAPEPSVLLHLLRDSLIHFLTIQLDFTARLLTAWQGRPTLKLPRQLSMKPPS